MSTREKYSFGEWVGSPRERPPTCRKHHTYHQTVTLESAGVWVCPRCGNYSDAAESYTGGVGLIDPEDAEQYVSVIGRIVTEQNFNRFPADPGFDAAMLTCAFEANEAVKAWEGERMWSDDRGAWLVPYNELHSVAETLDEHDRTLVNVYEIVIGRGEEF